MSRSEGIREGVDATLVLYGKIRVKAVEKYPGVAA